jgi:hypothetical protein
MIFARESGVGIIGGRPDRYEASPAIDDFSAADRAGYGLSSGIPRVAPANPMQRGQKDASIEWWLCPPSPALHGAAFLSDASRARGVGQTFQP